MINKVQSTLLSFASKKPSDPVTSAAAAPPKKKVKTAPKAAPATADDEPAAAAAPKEMVAAAGAAGAAAATEAAASKGATASPWREEPEEASTPLAPDEAAKSSASREVIHVSEDLAGSQTDAGLKFPLASACVDEKLRQVKMTVEVSVSTCSCNVHSSSPQMPSGLVEVTRSLVLRREVPKHRVGLY